MQVHRCFELTEKDAPGRSINLDRGTAQATATVVRQLLKDPGVENFLREVPSELNYTHESSDMVWLPSQEMSSDELGPYTESRQTGRQSCRHLECTCRHFKCGY